jgi:hypothetical protein
MQENVVYDFSLFEPKEDKEEERRQQEEELRAAQAAAAQKEAEKPKTRAASVLRPAVAIKWTALALAVALALSAVMLCNVKLTKLNDQISKAQTQLTAAQGEEVQPQYAAREPLDAERMSRPYAEQRARPEPRSTAQPGHLHPSRRIPTRSRSPRRKRKHLHVTLLNLIMEYL